MKSVCPRCRSHCHVLAAFYGWTGAVLFPRDGDAGATGGRGSHISSALLPAQVPHTCAQKFPASLKCFFWEMQHYTNGRRRMQQHLFFAYILNISDCSTLEPLPSHCSQFLQQQWVLKTGFQRRKWSVLRQGMGLIKPAKEVTLRNAKQSRHGQCCMMWVGSTKWKWVSITFL